MVMDPIPRDDWCKCTPGVEKNGKTYPPMAAKAGETKPISLLVFLVLLGALIWQYFKRN